MNALESAFKAFLCRTVLIVSVISKSTVVCAIEFKSSTLGETFLTRSPKSVIQTAGDELDDDIVHATIAQTPHHVRGDPPVLGHLLTWLTFSMRDSHGLCKFWRGSLRSEPSALSVSQEQPSRPAQRGLGPQGNTQSLTLVQLRRRG